MNDLMIKGYFGVKQFFTDLFCEEDGLSGVVVAILLVAVAVLAVALLWNQLSGYMENLWLKIPDEIS